MVALIDTNIIIDYLVNREPFSNDAEKIIELCKDGKFSGFIAIQSIVDCFYILRKVCSSDLLRDFFLNLSEIFTFTGASKDNVISALKNINFADFEDCVMYETAVFNGADCIVTRNPKDYVSSSIDILTPKQFIDVVK